MAAAVEPRAPAANGSGSHLEIEGYFRMRKQQSKEWKRMWAGLGPVELILYADGVTCASLPSSTMWVVTARTEEGTRII